MRSLFSVLALGLPLVLTLAVLAAPPVHAQQQPCGPEKAVAQALNEGYGEREVQSGVMPNGGRLVIYASEDRSTWSLVAVRGDGMACLVASGVDWEAAPDPFARRNARPEVSLP